MAASALALPFAGLYTRRAEALTRVEPVASAYCPVMPVADQTAGLPLLQLPEGFTYQSFGWAGDPMDDGKPTPIEHDGMAVVRSRVVDGEAELTFIRNHESEIIPMVGTIGAPASMTTRPSASKTTGNPIADMGRMDHEAVAHNPIRDSLYLTEDDRNQADLYKFMPNDLARQLGALEQGGRLFMAKVAGEDHVDLLDPKMGDHYQIEWIEIEDPDPESQPYTEVPHDADNVASGPFVQGRDKGCLRMSRLEGCWYSAADRLVYLVDTSSGVDDEGAIGHGDGSVWTLDPASDQLTGIYQSENQSAGNNFDNVTVSPRGGVLLCEDGGGYRARRSPDP